MSPQPPACTLGATYLGVDLVGSVKGLNFKATYVALIFARYPAQGYLGIHSRAFLYPRDPGPFLRSAVQRLLVHIPHLLHSITPC